MLRQSSERLLRQALVAACRGFSSSVAVTDAGAGRFPTWLGGSQRRVTVPLTQPLPGLDSAGYEAPPSVPITEVTTLSNGVRIVTEASTGPIASLGIYVNAGSIYENAATTGSSALLECLAFKSTKHRDSLAIMREVELIGANIMANAAREQMSYTIDCLRTHMPAALELLADCVVNPAFKEGELEDQKLRLAMMLSSPDIALTLMPELLMQEVYQGALSHPLIPYPPDLSHITPQVLHQFVQDHYTGPHLVLSGAGVHHQQLVDLAGPMLEGMPSGEGAKAAYQGKQQQQQGGAVHPPPPGSRGVIQPYQDPVSQYVGGMVHMPGSFPQANMILAFEYAGGWRDIQGSVVMTVLTYLMGGGSSFSSGGPGKGMHSCLYTRVLNNYHWCHSCAAFSNTQNNTGLLGIQAAAEPAYAKKMLDVICGELEVLTSPPPADQLERAKAMSISLIHNALESKAASAEDLGRQYLTYGHRVSGVDYVQMIQAVSPKAIAEFTQRLLASPPSLVLYGDGTQEVADYEMLSRRFEPRRQALADGGRGQRAAPGFLERLRQQVGRA